MLMSNVAVQDETPGPDLMPIRVKDTAVPTTPWAPTHDVETLRRYLRAVREWARVDWPQVYDDLDTVLHGKQEISHHAAGPSGGAPVRSYGDAEERIQRFCGALKLLVARALRDNTLAQVTLALAERLDEVGTVKGLFEC
jgi:hypothetical protein